MRVLLAPTEDFIKRERGQLSADVAPGSNVTIPVTNGNGLAVNDYVCIGYEGSEQAELCQINAVTNTSFTVNLLKFTHRQDTPFTKYRYNQRKFYGATSAGGTFAELVGSGSPADIQVDDPQGTPFEYTGLEGYTYFIATYFNSTTSENTDLTNSNAVLADESQRYCSIYAIRVQAGLTNNPFISDGTIEAYRKRAENEVDSYLNSRYLLPLINTDNVLEIPFIVENCTVLLAAGYMDYREYGKDGQGVKWLGEARGLLKKLQSPAGQQLLGSNKQELQTKTLTSGIQSYPDQVDNCNGPKRYFSMDQRF